MKSAEEIMQILEAFDVTRSYRDAGELAGCDHKTVAHWVTRRDAGAMSGEAVRRPRLIDPFLPKLEEWMEASKGKVRADVVHDMVHPGFPGASVPWSPSSLSVWSSAASARSKSWAPVSERGSPREP